MQPNDKSQNDARNATRAHVILLGGLCLWLAFAPSASADHDGDPISDGIEGVLCGSEAQRNIVNALPVQGGRCVDSSNYRNVVFEGGDVPVDQVVSVFPAAIPCVDVPQDGIFCPEYGFASVRLEGSVGGSASASGTQSIGPFQTPVGTFCVYTCTVPSKPSAETHGSLILTVTANGSSTSVPVPLGQGV